MNTTFSDFFPCGYQRRRSSGSNLASPPCGGKRLWADYFHPAGGLTGLFRYLSSGRIEGIGELTVWDDRRRLKLQRSEWLWWPDRVEMTHVFQDVVLRETKFITWEDVVVCEFELQNRGDRDCRLRLEPAGELFQSGNEAEMLIDDQNVLISLHLDQHFNDREIIISPNTRCKGKLALAFRLKGEPVAPLPSLKEHQEQFQQFFDGIPVFRCSNKLLERTYYYRWFLLRYNSAANSAGNLPHPCFYEGKHDTGGEWLFSRMIPCSTGHHILDGRWHQNPEICFGTISNYLLAQDKPVEYAPGKLFPCVSVGESHGHWFLNFIASSVEELLQIHPNKKWACQIVDGLAGEVLSTLELFDPKESGLPVCSRHGETAMEFQPSFFHSKGFPKMTRDNCWSGEHYDPLRRIDGACYLYANSLAVSRIMKDLGREDEADKFRKIAQKVRNAVNTAMWDSRDDFYFDLHDETLERIPVKQIVGFWPFSFGLAERKHLKALKLLMDESEFNTMGSPPSVSKSCKMYDPHNRWHGVRIHECLWNGPTWPFADSILLQGVGRAIKSLEYGDGNLFKILLERYSKLHFRDQGQFNDPSINEHYDAETGQVLSPVDDYFHSHYIDIIIRHVCGFETGPEATLTLYPLDVGLDWFSIKNVPFRGELYSAEYDRKNGFIVKKADKLIASSKTLGKLTLIS